MKTKYKYVEFAKDFRGDWLCFNRKSEDELGWIEYRTGWRQFVINTSPDIIFSAGCLDDISHFLGQLNKTKGCFKEKENA